MSLQHTATPETLDELFTRLTNMKCRIVSVRQEVAETDWSATVANAYNFPITETGATIQDAVEKAFVKAVMVGDAA